MAEIVVVGSINQDLTAVVERLPGPGETVLARGHFSAPGGKGANQAAAAALLGRSVGMIGRVGDDDGGRTLTAGLAALGVDTAGISVDPEVGTGLALITVDRAGENQIVVSAGANGTLRPEHLDAATLADAAVVLVQLEIPLDTVTAAVAGGGGSTTVILNPAPATPLDQGLLEQVDILVPNRSELGVLAGEPQPSELHDVERLARSLPVETVIVTLGAEGALLATAGAAEHIPPPQVEALDTVAAGDAFCGALADALVRGEPMLDAVRWAVAAGAVAATRPGAQTSLPTADEVRALLG